MSSSHPDPHHGFTPDDCRRSRRPLATLIATTAVCLAFLVQAPIAGATVPVSNVTPQIGLIPLPVDVVFLNQMGALIPVNPVSTPASAPLFTWRATRST
ncbi:MAG: hypothetical protein JO262_19690 [Solirubrobacterales bacterium]|nr:hypothetical protein [Solirubrobacterales bacterium]MBV9944362.1 hypothetical protein [Solirubrobacterales bacterium]